MKKILLLVLAALLCLSLFASCANGQDAYVPNGYQRISHDNADYYFYVPNDWVADLSTGIATAYVSAKDHSSVSFMAFEVNDSMIQVSKGEGSSDTSVTEATTATETTTDTVADTTITEATIDAIITDAVTEATEVTSPSDTASFETTDTTSDVTTTESSSVTAEGGAAEVPDITTLEEYWAYYDGELRATFADLAYSVEGESLMMADMKAKKYVYTATVTGTVYEFMQVVALKEGTVYIFTYTSTEGEVFDSHLETIHEIIGYIRLK